MEVINSNFFELLPRIRTAIEQCDFISIDCELTGLHIESTVNAFDTQLQYYEKVRKNSKDFLPIQYGLCIFRYDKDLQIFKQQGYNFYVFPRQANKMVPDHKFLCQASSIDFLIKRGFDFNKLFKEGIPYLNSIEEEKYKNSLLERQKLRANQNNSSPNNDKPDYISMTVEDKEIVDNIFKEIDEFIVNKEEERILPKCNAYIRRIIYQEANKRLQVKICLETRSLENNERVLVVRLKNEEREKQKIKEEEKEFTSCIGFSEVIKIIVESGKLVIGHNMCLDLLHTIDKFLTRLPEDYKEFKELANYSFPNLLDTKHMSSAEPFREHINSSVLPHLFKTVMEKPFEIPTVEIEDDREGYSVHNPKEHEAGYDAFVTGLSFLSMWNYLSNQHKLEVGSSASISLLRPYKNRIYLMRVLDAPYINLEGDDPTPSRDHVLYITFPKEWKLNDILQLFSPFGNVYVSWINDQSAYVALQRKNQVALALSTLSQSDTYSVMSYAKRQVQISGHNLIPYSPVSRVGRKRPMVNNSKTTGNKKRKMLNWGEGSISKLSHMAPIMEDPGELVLPKPDSKLNKSAGNKTFEESNNWD